MIKKAGFKEGEELKEIAKKNCVGEKMRSLIGEFIFGLGIAIMGGSIVLMQDRVSEYFPEIWGIYVGILMISGIILIIVGAKRIAKFDKNVLLKKAR